MSDNKVNEMCDKAVAVLNNCRDTNFISDKECNTLVSEIQTLKSKQERSLASKISELHEKNLKDYVEETKGGPSFSQDFYNLQTDCISLLNEIEAALYVREKFKS